MCFLGTGGHVWYLIQFTIILILQLLDSSKPASRNSANVTFHNLSGKDIVVSAKPDIENSTKEIELKAGSRATLKIDESSMDEPISFSARWMKDSDKELLLNGNTTFKVRMRHRLSL